MFITRSFLAVPSNYASFTVLQNVSNTEVPYLKVFSNIYILFYTNKRFNVYFSVQNDTNLKWLIFNTFVKTEINFENQ